MNGIAGGEPLAERNIPQSLFELCLLAFAEMVPVIHIVGIASTLQHKTRPLLHHTLEGR